MGFHKSAWVIRLFLKLAFCNRVVFAFPLEVDGKNDVERVPADPRHFLKFCIANTVVVGDKISGGFQAIPTPIIGLQVEGDTLCDVSVIQRPLQHVVGVKESLGTGA